MRSSLRNARSRADGPQPPDDNRQYCAFCAAEMPFECIDPADYRTEEPAEWICTTCGTALLIDPPTQSQSA